MSNTEFEKEFYRKALNNASQGSASTGYGQPINQQVRFHTLAKQVLTGLEGIEYSMLDVGCGTGDLLGFMLAQELELPDQYLGIDRMPEMVERCKARFATHPKFKDGSWKFEVHDGVHELDGSYDIVVSIAAFALKPVEWHLADSMDYVQAQLGRMAELCNWKLFVTLFSMWKNNILPEEMVVGPAAMINWGLQTFKRVDLIHSYAPFDFAMLVHMDEGEWWSEWNQQ